MSGELRKSLEQTKNCVTKFSSFSFNASHQFIPSVECPGSKAFFRSYFRNRKNMIDKESFLLLIKSNLFHQFKVGINPLPVFEVSFQISKHSFSPVKGVFSVPGTRHHVDL